MTETPNQIVNPNEAACDHTDDHPCGGHGAADGICKHEDGNNHVCCQAEANGIQVDISLLVKS